MADMSFTTKATLSAAIAAELDRDDLTEKIPGFIRLAESDIASDLTPQSTVTRAYFTANEDYENLPSNWVQPISMRVLDPTDRVEIFFTTPAQIASLRQQNLTGTPRFYTIVGTQFWFDRTPTDVTIEIDYYATAPQLDGDDDSNAILLQYPTLYFYGALKHSAPYLKDDDRLGLWGTLYEKALRPAVISEERAKYGHGPLVQRPRISRGFP